MKKKRVVVLDDDEVFAALITEILEPECEAAHGHNGLDGIRLCLEARADLLITDIGMPEMDGERMLEEFQKDPRLASIPVLVLTATHFTRQSREAVSRHPQVLGVLHKTSDLSSIAQVIQDALKD